MISSFIINIITRLGYPFPCCSGKSRTMFDVTFCLCCDLSVGHSGAALHSLGGEHGKVAVGCNDRGEVLRIKGGKRVVSDG